MGVCFNLEGVAEYLMASILANSLIMRCSQSLIGLLRMVHGSSNNKLFIILSPVHCRCSTKYSSAKRI
jgi:hypothetical protein